MFRFARTVFSRANALVCQNVTASSALQKNILRNIPERGFTVLTGASVKPLQLSNAIKYLASPSVQSNVSAQLECVPIRTITKFSVRNGKRKTSKAVIRRFFRLHWGGWIRTRCGRHKKMWKKSGNRKRRLRQHVFVNAQQAWLLDRMVTKCWKRPKHYIDDIYEPYHQRSYYFARRKPMQSPKEPLPEGKSFWKLSKEFD